MVEFMFFIFMIVVVVCATTSVSKDKEAEKAFAVLDKCKDFIGYCERHRDELPGNIRERFDELESFVNGSKTS